jgi:succinyl-CoA synthetase beta subunit
MSLQLTEHLSKALLAPFGVPIGAYRLASSPAEARDAAAFYGTPVAVKGQVPAGSRGRSGAVLHANTAAAAARAFTSVTAVEVDGLRAVQALVEPWHDITQELYLAVTFDTQRQAPVLLFSAVGGVDVESHADHMRTLLLPAEAKLSTASIVALAEDAAIDILAREPLAQVACNLAKAFFELEAHTVELNPLAEVSSGVWLAVDARVVLDANALFRHPAVRALSETMLPRRPEDLVREATKLEFVPLDGTIGLISGGAGMTMAAMDLMRDYGGRAACFLDCSADVTPRGYAAALDLVLGLDGVRSILVSVFGGLTRVDSVAKTFVDLLARVRVEVPVVFRLTGTNQGAAAAILQGAGLHNFVELDDAVAAVVEAASFDTGLAS